MGDRRALRAASAAARASGTGSRMPISVTIAVMRAAGVTSCPGSNAEGRSGFQPLRWVTIPRPGRSSMGMPSPDAIAGSTVVTGVATYTGTGPRRAAAAISAAIRLPATLLVSPLAAIHSAPTITASTGSVSRTYPIAASGMTTTSVPVGPSSQVARRAPSR